MSAGSFVLVVFMLQVKRSERGFEWSPLPPVAVGDETNAPEDEVDGSGGLMAAAPEAPDLRNNLLQI
jgi:hypothetical protein